MSSTCIQTKKRQYRSWKEAYDAADRAKIKYGGIFKAYECPDCNLLHIGHLIPARKRSFQSRLNAGAIPGR